MMSAGRSKYAWIVISLASIFICLITEATPLAANSAQLKPLKISLPTDEFFSIDNTKDEPTRKTIVSRSADDDNTLDDDNDVGKKTEKPEVDNSEEKPPESPHQHGSHGPLGPVKHLLNTVRDRFHGNGGGALGRIGVVTNILGAHHEATTHESPIETEKDRTKSNSGTGLQVLEFFGTIFGLVWGFLSNIPALFGSSSAGLSGGGN